MPPPDSATYRGRFAPSPTGDLHLGSLLAALGSWLVARSRSGAWLVRVEDLDPPRERPGVAARQLRDLSAFGLESDEPVVFQSSRGDAYAEALARLQSGGWAFPCLCSRSDLAAMDGIHRACVAHPSGTRPAWRVRLPPGVVSFEDRFRGPQASDPSRETGDTVVLRADGYWAYQLAVVVDDAWQGITEVVRGADLLDSTARQVALQGLLGVPTPAYAHLPVVREASGAKLSKSLLSLPVDAADPLPALRAAYGLLGQDTGPLSGPMTPSRALQRALSGFDPAKVPPRDAFLP